MGVKEVLSMSRLAWIVLFLALAGLFILLYSLLKVAHDADEKAGYMEEYSWDLNEEEEDD